MTLAELKALPQGTFEAEDWIDDDGLGNGPFKIQVKVTIAEDKFVADFTGSHAQVPGPINNSRTGLISAVRTILKAITNPQIAANGGCFRAIEVICPDGTLFTCERPAPVSLYWETMMAGADLIWKALAPHAPDRLTAGHFLSVCATIIAGNHPDTDEFYLLVEPLVGGWGAGATKDGENGQFASADGETYNIPIEVAETRYGVICEQYAFHGDEGRPRRVPRRQGRCAGLPDLVRGGHNDRQFRPPPFQGLGYGGRRRCLAQLRPDPARRRHRGDPRHVPPRAA